MYLTIKEYWLAFEHNSSSHQLVEVEQWSRVGNDAQVISYLCDNQHGSINHNPINLGSQYVTFAWHTVPVHIALSKYIPSLRHATLQCITTAPFCEPILKGLHYTILTLAGISSVIRSDFKICGVNENTTPCHPVFWKETIA